MNTMMITKYGAWLSFLAMISLGLIAGCTTSPAMGSNPGDASNQDVHPQDNQNDNTSDGQDPQDDPSDDQSNDNQDTEDPQDDEPDTPPELAYLIVDTGQDTCFDELNESHCPSEGQAFYGQDAQFDSNAPSYTISTDGLTVYDNITGLTWQVSYAPDKITYDEAPDYADQLNAQNYGGYSDWRVPSIKELYSLIDFRGTDPMVEGNDTTGLTPFIDTDYFDFEYGDTDAGERIIDSQWVTTTLYVADTNMTFGVNFADGRIKGYGRTTPDPRDTSEKMFFVRLCRGNENYGINNFTDNGDGTITDDATGLMWSQDDSGEGLNWEEALAWAEEMNTENYLGYNDWRLPNIKELQSILDYTRSPDTTGSAAIDPLFNATQITNLAGEADYPFYWSSTTHIRQDGSGGSGCYMAFGRGLGTYDGSTIQDVHGAGCQRSDPKDGNSNDYPSLGHGPQGDMQRVFNYVRLVR